MKDWLSTYLKARRERTWVQAIDFRTAELARGAAPHFFDKLAMQVQKDVEEYRRATGAKVPNFQWAGLSNTGKAFAVSAREDYPFLSLDVTLNDIFISFTRTVKRDAGHDETETGQIRITANLQGKASGVINGGPNCDETDLSEFLLKPMFDELG